MKDKEFDELKKELLPKELQDNFAKNREVFDRNIEKFENVIDAIKESNLHPDMKVTIDYIVDSLLNSQRTDSIMFEHMEMMYFACFLFRKQLDQTEYTLKKHGIIIERIAGYEKGLRFVDDYIKHHPEGKEIE